MSCVAKKACEASSSTIEDDNLSAWQDEEQYTNGTVPSFCRLRSITLNPLYDATFSLLYLQ